MKPNTLESIQEDFGQISKDPSLILSHWGNASPLFNFVGDDIDYHKMFEEEDDDFIIKSSGCLTQIREDQGRTIVAFLGGVPHVALTKEIAKDVRLPFKFSEIFPGHLPVFKEWQERILEMEKKNTYIPKDPSTLLQIDEELLNYDHPDKDDDDFELLEAEEDTKVD